MSGDDAHAASSAGETAQTGLQMLRHEQRNDLVVALALVDYLLTLSPEHLAERAQASLQTIRGRLAQARDRLKTLS
jgi:DNA-directed RNA polymerase specialized sigma24 family protein